MTKAEAIQTARLKLEGHATYHFLSYIDDDCYAELKNESSNKIGIHTLCAAKGSFLVRVVYSEDSDVVKVTVVGTYKNSNF